MLVQLHSAIQELSNSQDFRALRYLALTFDLMTFKAFFVMPNYMMNICVKFY